MNADIKKRRSFVKPLFAAVMASVREKWGKNGDSDLFS